ncbi:hypothetical protein G3480_22955 [Thiorhodococcus mannitoliphagus]|uniref:Uncharacterized protein n=2 Tax=Thiorhodococcus mannitoliphagus TaxID=329406 RepID=A0A6P1E3P1_9GAMM|nr:hypothetical protein [Thiorhodococcus mannitoliphagus]
MRVEDMAPGMHLAKDIYDPNGNVLMRSGAEITERLIKALRSWGISEVAIKTAADEDPGMIRDPKAVAEIRALLDQQFSLSNRDHPMIQALYDLCLDRALGKR